MTFTKKQREQVAKLARQLGLELVVAFGSQVNGAAGKNSDLDIAVQTRLKSNYKRYKLIYEVMSDVFSGENVDVSFLNQADPLFSMQIAKGGQLLFGNENQYNEFVALTNKRYVDDGQKYFPFLNQMLANQNRRLQEKK